MKISAKKEQELYNVIHEQVMNTRIEISKLLKFKSPDTSIDDLLSNLCRTAPLAAVMVFKKKEPTEKKEVEYPEYKEFIDLWDQRYHELGLQMPKDGSKIKSIIRQTRDYIKNSGHDPTEENCKNFWGAFIKALEKTWAHGKNLSMIDSKYTELIFEMKYGKQRTNIEKPSASRTINSL